MLKGVHWAAVHSSDEQSDLHAGPGRSCCPPLALLEVGWAHSSAHRLCGLLAACCRAFAGQSCPVSPPGPPPPAPPAPAPPHWLPVKQLSARFRNWSYYVGQYDGFVVPPDAGNFAGQSLTDTAVVFEKSPDDTLPGRYRMTYLWFNATTGGEGYEVGLALSDNLLNWTFNQGGDNGLAFKVAKEPHAARFSARAPRTAHRAPRTARLFSGRPARAPAHLRQESRLIAMRPRHSSCSATRCLGPMTMAVSRSAECCGPTARYDQPAPSRR